MKPDDPAVAESIVAHAKTLCEREDHLWDVLENLSIPTKLLTDTRNQSRSKFETDEIAKAFLYQHIHGLSENELANRLKTRVTLVHSFGFDLSNKNDAPRQQAINYIWNEGFSDSTQQIIRAAAEGIRQVAVEHDVIAEALVSTDAPETTSNEPSDDKSTREYKREKSTKTVDLARKHVLPEFDTKRAEHCTYSDTAIWDMFAQICANHGSAHSEGEYAWLTDDELWCDDETFLRAIKKAATPAEENKQLTLSDFPTSDSLPIVEAIRGEVLRPFGGATENIINTVRGENLFDGRRNVAAIDITTEQFHVYPWEDKDAGIPKPDYPEMVSGYKKDGEIIYVYKYATITLVGDNAPIILGVEAVKEKSNWESDNAASFSKADIVSRLLDQAEQYVDLDEVLMDRGFYSNEVYKEIDDRGLIYTTPVPKYEEDYENIEKIQSHPEADEAVLHDVPFGYEGEVHHSAEFLYVPVQDDDADGNYAVFVTNRDRVEPEDISRITNRYRRRWDIENQYLTVKSFLPKTSSKDYRVRLLRFVLTSLIYNLWRLTDYLVKIAIDMDIRSPPVITAKTFVRVLSDFLRDIG